MNAEQEAALDLREQLHAWLEATHPTVDGRIIMRALVYELAVIVGLNTVDEPPAAIDDAARWVAAELTEHARRMRELGIQ